LTKNWGHIKNIHLHAKP